MDVTGVLNNNEYNMVFDSLTQNEVFMRYGME